MSRIIDNELMVLRNQMADLRAQWELRNKQAQALDTEIVLVSKKFEYLASLRERGVVAIEVVDTQESNLFGKAPDRAIPVGALGWDKENV